MSDCASYQELISRMLDGEVSRDEHDALARHIVTCPDCQAVYVAFRSLSETLREDLAEPPEELHENIMASLRREDLKKRNAPRKKTAAKQQKRARRGAWALAACAAVAILAVTSLPRLFRAGSAAPQAAMSMAEPAEAPAPKAAEAPMADGAPAAGMANDALSEAAQAEKATDAGEAERGLQILEEGEQTRAFRAVLTEEPEAEPEGEPDESFQVAYTDYGEPCTVTVRLYGDRAYYARSEGESCRIACSASELLDILG